MQDVIKALSPTGRDKALANGIHIGDERFVVTDIGTDDPKNTYIKMRKVSQKHPERYLEEDENADRIHQGKEGAFVIKTDQTMILTHHPENNVLQPSLPATSQEAFNSSFKFAK